MLYKDTCARDTGKRIQRRGFFVRFNPTQISIIGLCLILVCINSAAFAHTATVEIEIITEDLKKEPDNKDLLLKRAYLYRVVKNYGDSLKELNDLIKKHPEDKNCYIERARLHGETKKYELSEADYTRVIELGGKDKVVYPERAHIRQSLKKYELAIEDYQAGAKYRQWEDFYYYFGKLHEKSGQPKKAIGAYHMGLGHYQRSILLTRALIQLLIEHKDYEQAHKVLVRQLQNERFKTPWLMLEGEIYNAEAPELRKKAMGLWQQALKECDDILKKRNRSVLHKTYRAEILLAMGDVKGADKEISSLLKRSPRYSKALEVKKRIEAKQSQAAETDNSPIKASAEAKETQAKETDDKQAKATATESQETQAVATDNSPAKASAKPKETQTGETNEKPSETKGTESKQTQTDGTGK